MGATVLYMSMSVDGFIAGPNAGPGNGLGDGGERLHDWLLTGDEHDGSGVPSLVSAGVNGQIVEEFMATGAVVAGRGTFEPAAGWGGDHHDGVSIFVLSRHEPTIDITSWPHVSYVDNVEAAISGHERRRARRTCWCTGPGPLSSRSLRGSSMSLSFMSYLFCSCKGDGYSTTSLPSCSSSNAPGSFREKAVSVTCTTGCTADRHATGERRPGPSRRSATRVKPAPSTNRAGRGKTTPTRSVRVKILPRVLFALYLVTLLWLILFKLSYDIPSILVNYQSRSLNLIPFVGLGETGLSETVSNFVTFVPFGLLLGVTVKDAVLWRLVVVVLVFSMAVETLQFILAIGTSDVTDVLTNTLGGLTGLVLHRLVNKLVRAEILDRIITVVGLILFVALILLRLLVLRVRY